VLDGAGHVGYEVSKNRFDVGEIKRAGNVLCGIIEDYSDIDRQCAKQLA
jgi:hypothetical protein